MPAATPVEADESEARGVFARLGPKGSFMGIRLSPETVLQFYFNLDATVHAEVLKEEEMETRSTTVTVPLGELLIEAVYHGEDLEQKIAFSRVSWTDEKLRRRPIQSPEPTSTAAPRRRSRLS
ncbi:hypothetical protein [Actomonas aquatica]|uniref:CSD domain-containing protein n=1 Tax=Actomonas aquatica TaxID=2866162 RepID=A0ABZ1CAW9_9BACT|nr:hypothetical protein [Opitutus sp. WL0086]WRQ88842.1 hypothetical protein K1X11_005455 [Opitutus sp. WL0086]WRQ88848.1 hypothetical protein K1X11_005485 [Opitutus sp. WL0086]